MSSGASVSKKLPARERPFEAVEVLLRAGDTDDLELVEEERGTVCTCRVASF